MYVFLPSPFLEIGSNEQRTTHTPLQEFVLDATWFVSVNRSKMEQQASYISKAVFLAPTYSIVQKAFFAYRNRHFSAMPPLLYIWKNLPVNQWTHTLVGHTDWVISVVFSPDGRALTSTTIYDEVIVWDVWSSNIRRKLEGHTNIGGVVCSPKGTMIASVSDLTIEIVEVRSGRQLTVIREAAIITAPLVFSPDEKILASVTGNTITLWNIQSGKQIQILKLHTGWVGVLAISPDNNMVTSLFLDRTFRIWDVKSGKERWILNDSFGSSFTAIAFSPDSTMLASVECGKIRLRDAQAGKLLSEAPQARRYFVKAMAFSPDGTRVALGAYDGRIMLWSPRSGRDIETLGSHEKYVTAVTFSPDGTMLASASHDETVKIWDIRFVK
jgi:WD40 repeat protein